VNAAHPNEITAMPKIRVDMPECGPTNITKDALTEWNEATQQWILYATYDCDTCQNCEAERDSLALRVEIAASDTHTALTSGFADATTYLLSVTPETATAGFSTTKRESPTGVSTASPMAMPDERS